MMRVQHCQAKTPESPGEQGEVRVEKGLYQKNVQVSPSHKDRNSTP